MPSIGKQFKKDEVFGFVEAAKTTHDLSTHGSGEVIEINNAWKDNPPLVNSASFTDAWMIKIKLVDVTEANTLLDAKAYEGLAS